MDLEELDLESWYQEQALSLRQRAQNHLSRWYSKNLDNLVFQQLIKDQEPNV